MARYTILSTKELEPSLKEAVTQKGIELTEVAFISVQPIRTKEKQTAIEEWMNYPEKIALVFTSQHAAATVISLIDDVYYVNANQGIFCLDGSTRKAVLQYFKEDSIVATGSSGVELAEKIIDNGSFQKVVFFCGNQRREELPALLKEKGIEVTEVIVYETTPTPVVTTDNFDAVLFFSPSAVQSFFEVNSIPPTTACFAIGPTTAAAIAEYTSNRIITSAEPSQEMMITSVFQSLASGE